METLKDYLRVSEAAAYLGVSPNTLRAWADAEKVASRRHPINGYRLFRQTDLDVILNRLSTNDADSDVNKPR